ncbi:MAG TPA: methyltransferase [Cyanobacteria bacterium UBA9273]|nr:methyltransferase [Cyanobacteria bacterium UBA9273]
MNWIHSSKRFFNNFQREILAFIHRKNLGKLSPLYDDSKWEPGHWYAEHYQRHFAPLRLKKLKILEIGVGGYDDPKAGGRSLRMWKKYFRNSLIYGIDLVKKKALEENRIKIFQGSQTDESFLRDVLAETGGLDIIIEDGSSSNEAHIKTFKTLFPALNEGGIYAAENIHHSYWPSLSGERWSSLAKGSIFLENWIGCGGSLDLNDPKTLMNMYKRLVDGLNYQDFLRPGYSPSYFDKHIVSIHFYPNLVILYKGNNDKPSNFIENNALRPFVLEKLGVESLEELGLEFSLDNSTPECTHLELSKR